MTFAEFDELLTRCFDKAGVDSDAVPFLQNTMGRVEGAKTAAWMMWLNEAPEDADTRALRHQIKQLREHGVFDME